MSELILDGLEAPKAVFFDWDGTLVDSFSFLQDIHNYVLEMLDLPARPDGWFTDYFGKERDWIYQDIYGDLDPQARVLFAEYLVENHVSVLKAMEGAQDILALLTAHGIVCGIVTNKQGDWVRKEVEAFGWGKYFSSVVGAGEAGVDKPSSKPLEKAVKDACINFLADQIWFVGDTDSDLNCAKGYGAPAILIHPDPSGEPWYGCFDPYMIFDDCQGFHVFLLQKLSKSLQKREK